MVAHDVLLAWLRLVMSVDEAGQQAPVSLDLGDPSLVVDFAGPIEPMGLS